MNVAIVHGVLAATGPQKQWYMPVLIKWQH